MVKSVSHDSLNLPLLPEKLNSEAPDSLRAIKKRLIFGKRHDRGNESAPALEASCGFVDGGVFLYEVVLKGCAMSE